MIVFATIWENGKFSKIYVFHYSLLFIEISSIFCMYFMHLFGIFFLFMHFMFGLCFIHFWIFLKFCFEFVSCFGNLLLFFFFNFLNDLHDLCNLSWWFLKFLHFWRTVLGLLCSKYWFKISVLNQFFTYFIWLITVIIHIYSYCLFIYHVYRIQITVHTYIRYLISIMINDLAFAVVCYSQYTQYKLFLKKGLVSNCVWKVYDTHVFSMHPNIIIMINYH